MLNNSYDNDFVINFVVNNVVDTRLIDIMKDTFLLYSIQTIQFCSVLKAEIKNSTAELKDIDRILPKSFEYQITGWMKGVHIF